MNWNAALGSPWLWSLLAAVPIGIVLLYFLKLRREPVEVPSTYLWQKTIEDLHVNSLLQRLRRSVLLLVQLLIVGLAAIALFRPGIRGSTSGQGRVVHLLDTSASMNATDSPDQRSRFEIARQQVREQIEQMTDQDTAMLITFNDRAEVLQSFTSDRGRLRDALDRAVVTNRPTNIQGALRAADGLANPRRSSELGDVNDVQVADALPATLMLYSDGGFAAVTEFDLGNLVPKYQPVGGDQVNNLSVVTFSAQRNLDDPTQIEAFGTVLNSGTVPASSDVSLMIGGELVDADRVSLAPGEQAGLTFAITDDDAIAMRLIVDAEDDLVLDNTAHAGLTPVKTVSVLVITPGNKPLELGLQTAKANRICLSRLESPEFMQSDEFKTRMQAGVDDLVIFDRCTPEKMPPTNTFFIGALPPAFERPTEDSLASEVDASPTNNESLSWGWASPPGPLVLIDVDRAHPLLRFVNLFSLLIFEGRTLDAPPGSNTLVEGDRARS
ncbi:MAG: BatA and WFA domain-containing protein [Planctomycetota bacterium]